MNGAADARISVATTMAPHKIAVQVVQRVDARHPLADAAREDGVGGEPLALIGDRE
jgi:hypothetical protein